ncbi:MAG: ABC transporter permease subunit [Hyphomicrobiales bacterium]|nr:ABC transporter permease subunit [Hyphomicrobiales bacterium]MDE2113377.1 ABC transporter permease subunit [Hyphomicrobiales bacterium]
MMKSHWHKWVRDWSGVAPFLVFSALFLIFPTMYLIVGAFRDSHDHFTLANFLGLLAPEITGSFFVSLEISAVSAILGMGFGFALTWAIAFGGLPAQLRATIVTFCGVASNFAGIPLAFAFLASVGRIGFVTSGLRHGFGIDIYAMGFNLLSVGGLIMTYLYFQIPLMVLIFLPVLDGIKREWGEAAQILGANSWQYWRHILFPMLWPSVIGSAILLFANAFGAIATAYALTGSSVNLITLLLYAQIRGDVLHNENLGFAMAFGMIAITGISNFCYLQLRSRSETWLR